MEVPEDTELSAELQKFIDQLIVPLLVDAFLTQTGHLYSARSAYYDGEGLRADAAEEAA